MRVATRPAFTPRRDESADDKFLALLGTAIIGLALFASVFGTIMWAFGLTLVDAGALDSSWSWWTFFRVAGLLHLTRGVLVVWAKRTTSE